MGKRIASWGEAKKVPATVPKRAEVYAMIRKGELHHVPEWVRIAWESKSRKNTRRNEL